MQEEWQQYSERLGHFFAGIEITDATRKSDLFLSVIVAKTYKLLSDLVSPDKPAAKPHHKLLQKLTDHYSPDAVGL